MKFIYHKSSSVPISHNRINYINNQKNNALKNNLSWPCNSTRWRSWRKLETMSITWSSELPCARGTSASALPMPIRSTTSVSPPVASGKESGASWLPWILYKTWYSWLIWDFVLCSLWIIGNRDCFFFLYKAFKEMMIYVY